MISFPVIQIDIWQLTAALLVTAILNEFVIKPTVDFLRKHTGRFMKSILERNGNGKL